MSEAGTTEGTAHGTAESGAKAWTAREAESATRRWIGEIERVVHGKPEVVRRAVVCLLARGHLLIEDVPGVGKTTLAQALARTLDAEFRRIQFTSDLLPGDLTGLSIPESGTQGAPTRFRFQPGPLFANLVLADEVNRASPRTQSALLEAMAERTVSVDGVSHPLPEPFFVVATQNPLEHHGTHPLPESQLDRFLMRLSIGYPSREHEARVLAEDPGLHALPRLERVIDLEAIVGLQQAALAVKVEESLLAYLIDLVEATRLHEGLALGASTRGALALRRAAQAHALIDGRDYCIPEDLRELAVDVLAHRVAVHARGGLRPDAEEARWIVSEIVDRVAIPL
ncbi:MAG: MoxR family ATPase [Spirochaetaceae bacterium]|nr:MoxR family ATPase [Myxococcales bacterium]MCB9726201.1 MoxR family ATPase [Spirochaetaceae bacterium]HPG27271.1 MoxR family ATPase [Myxococcota bacterium]